MTGARALLVWGLVFLVALTLGAWLGGMIFFQIAGLDLGKATPLSLLQYWPYRDLAAWQIGAGAPLLLFGGFLAAAFWPKTEKVHGDAKWAREPDIARAGLRAKTGILLGRKGGRFLMSEAAAHTLLVAPTRSGKGVGVIVPNLLNFDGSAVVLDIKFENFDITAGFRAEHGAVFLFSPMAPEGRSHRYNPLHEVRRDPVFRVTDLQLVASYLIPLPEKNPVWDQLARSLFVGLCLYVMDDPESEPTIGAIYRTLNRTGAVDFTDWVVELVENTPDWLDPECDRLLSAYAAMTAKERAFVRTSLNSALNLWSSPLVDAATAGTDFELGDLRRRRMSVYVGVTHSQMSALRPLLSLFFQQVIAALSERKPDADEPHKVLILLDEFASLGKMESIASAVTMLAGYGGRLMFVLQGLGTLEENYGRAGGDVIVQNCANQIFFAPNDETTARYVVARLGRKTVRQESKSRFKGGVSRQTSDTGRDLMMPQELRSLHRDKEIVLIEGAPPILAEKIAYHRDAAFTARLRDAPPVPMLDTAGRGGRPAPPPQGEPPAPPVPVETAQPPQQPGARRSAMLRDTTRQLDELAELLQRNGVGLDRIDGARDGIEAFDREA